VRYSFHAGDLGEAVAVVVAISAAALLGGLGVGGEPGCDEPDIAAGCGQTTESGVSGSFELRDGGRVSDGGGSRDAALTVGR